MLIVIKVCRPRCTYFGCGKLLIADWSVVSHLVKEGIKKSKNCCSVFFFFAGVVTIFYLLSSVKRQINSWYFKRFYSLQRRSTVYRDKFLQNATRGGGCFSTLYSHTQSHWVAIIQLYFSSLGEEANGILLNHVCTALLPLGPIRPLRSA